MIAVTITLGDDKRLLLLLSGSNGCGLLSLVHGLLMLQGLLLMLQGLLLLMRLRLSRSLCIHTLMLLLKGVLLLLVLNDVLLLLLLLLTCVQRLLLGGVMRLLLDRVVRLLHDMRLLLLLLLRYVDGVDLDVLSGIVRGVSSASGGLGSRRSGGVHGAEVERETVTTRHGEV